MSERFASSPVIDPSRPVRRMNCFAFNGAYVTASPSSRPDRMQRSVSSEAMYGAYTQTHVRSFVDEHIVEDRTGMLITCAYLHTPGWSTRSARHALGHESDITIVDSDAHDMDDVSWTAQGDTTVTLLHVAPRDDAPLAPPSRVSDSIAQVVCAIACSHTSRRNP